MDWTASKSPMAPVNEPLLQVYLLGCAPFEAVLALERRLVHRVEGDRQQSALIVCEHPPIITVGRLGSRAHISYEPDELRARGWPIRWINRGGGCLLHLPGQLAIYPIVALDRLGWNLREYLDRLACVVTELLRDFSIAGQFDSASGNICVERRPIAMLGISVQRWVAYHGAFVNVHPNLDLMRRVRTASGSPQVTSFERERHGPAAMPRVRQRAIELVAEHLGIVQSAIFFRHFPQAGAPTKDRMDLRFTAQDSWKPA